MTEDFVHRENVRHYQYMLATAPDERTRAMAQRLLDQEIADYRRRRSSETSHGAEPDRSPDGGRGA